jgi:eukaryotic-like serine/threonine-protein kinase
MQTERVRGQLDRILASAAFADAERASRFLRFVVERALEGRAGEIKETVVAVEVLGRNPSFDPRSDPIVRTEAGRLRTRLNSYYEAEGKADEIQIGLPKGGYVPEFAERRPVSSPRKERHPVLLVACGVLLGLVAAVPALLYLRRTPASNDTLSFSIPPPRGAVIESSVISPDGRRVAFTAVFGGTKRIWVRALDSIAPSALEGTEDASYPFWSPDGRSLGFFSRGKLKRIDISGGPPQVLCEIGISFGGTWGSGEVILFPPQYGALSQVAATGGTPKPVLALDSSRGEFSQQFPQFLPDGRHFLYFVPGRRPGESSIRAGSLDSKSSKLLLNADAIGVYAPALDGQLGSLLFVYRGALMAQSFDPQRLELSGERTVVSGEIWYADGKADVSASANGVLAYQTASRKDQQLSWFDREGKLLETVGPVNDYGAWSLSPDETRVAMTEVDPSGRGAAIWIMDLTRQVPNRLTDEFPRKFLPIWSPDGSEVLFSALATRQDMSLQRQALNGRTSVTVLEATPGPKFPTDWSSDGRFITYFTPGPDFRKLNIWIMPLDGSSPRQPPRPFLPGPYSEDSAYFSPSNAGESPRWIAYTSDETGRDEVHVRNLPAGDRQWRISSDGGRQPHWRRDGRELFYLTQDGTLMAVELKSNAAKDGALFDFGPPRALFRTGVRPYRGPPQVKANAYAVSRDGQRFLVNRMVSEAPMTPITIVTHWQPGSSARN